ncbi:ABC transporter ATP-binding protein [Clostridium cellulovorans]|uniref:ABC transporter related n=1 Tax=Clostridium cellulovorans (strain ATCC 35296 / DSM 3052 / OCM 3 / 743B) TaxID=573061 RepID=D9SWM5_CLOC7|nr:ABC transporter ATP-binding protein [Clostridium cellulovorans]ADL53307.1 ABC transporter related [Clostridium cellulovorans 743B]
MIVENLVKNYGDTQALKGINFSIAAPAFVGLIGHNGSGKSTLLEILMGIKKHTSGTITFDEGLNPENFKEKLGVILQSNAFYDSIKVYELLRLFKTYYKETYDIDYLIEVLNMGSYKNKYYSSLSGGMKQKVNLALAFINKPKLVLLDEPTTGLDPLARKEFWEALHKLCNNTLLFLSSHYMEEVQEHCSKIVYLHDGNLVFAGDTKELLEKENLKSLSDVYLRISGGKKNAI